MHEIWRRARGSVRLRITLVASLVFALAFGIAAWVLVRSVQTRLESGVQRDALAGAMLIAGQLEADVPITDIQYRAGTFDAVVLDQRAHVIAGAATVQVLPPPALDIQSAPAGVGTTPVRVLRSSFDGGSSAVATVSSFVDGEPVTVLATSPLAGVRRSVDALASTLLVVTPLLVAAVGVLVWLLVGRALRPVAAITSEVEVITHTTMHRRVPVPASNDEISRLARTMNDMLARLHSANERQQVFVSDASHELRTPVATVQTLLEVGLRGGDVEGAATRALEANGRLGAIVVDLLDLARLDGQPVATADLPVVDLEDVVLGVLDPEVDSLVDTSQVLAGRVRGDRGLLARAVRNLVDNARRHARHTVSIALGSEGDRVLLHVDDDGPGIPPEERERIFERFVRLGDDRTRSAGGTGLGLAIVQQIATQHGGSVRALSAPGGGARLELALPSAVAAAGQTSS